MSIVDEIKVERKLAKQRNSLGYNEEDSKDIETKNNLSDIQMEEEDTFKIEFPSLLMNPDKGLDESDFDIREYLVVEQTLINEIDITRKKLVELFLEEKRLEEHKKLVKYQKIAIEKTLMDQGRAISMIKHSIKEHQFFIILNEDYNVLNQKFEKSQSDYNKISEQFRRVNIKVDNVVKRIRKSKKKEKLILKYMNDYIESIQILKAGLDQKIRDIESLMLTKTTLMNDLERKSGGKKKRINVILGMKEKLAVEEDENKKFIDTDIWQEGVIQRIEISVLLTSLNNELDLRKRELVDLDGQFNKIGKENNEKLVLRGSLYSLREEIVSVSNRLSTLIIQLNQKSALEEMKIRIKTELETELKERKKKVKKKAVEKAKQEKKRKRKNSIVNEQEIMHNKISMGELIKNKYYEDRTEEENQWLSVNDILENNNDIDPIENESFPYISRENVIRISKLPHQVNFAMPFLKDQREYLVYRLISKFTWEKDDDYWKEYDAMAHLKTSSNFSISSFNSNRLLDDKILLKTNNNNNTNNTNPSNGKEQYKKIYCISTMSEILSLDNNIIQNTNIIIEQTKPIQVFELNDSIIDEKQTRAHTFEINTDDSSYPLQLTLSVVYQGLFTPKGYKEGKIAVSLYRLPKQNSKYDDQSSMGSKFMNRNHSISMNSTQSGDTSSTLNEPILVGYSPFHLQKLNTERNFGRIVILHHPSSSNMKHDDQSSVGASLDSQTVVNFDEHKYQIVIGSLTPCKYSILLTYHKGENVDTYFHNEVKKCKEYEMKLPKATKEIDDILQGLRLAERKLEIVNSMIIEADQECIRRELEMDERLSGLDADEESHFLNLEERKNLNEEIGNLEIEFSHWCHLYALRQRERKEIIEAIDIMGKIRRDKQHALEKLKNKIMKSKKEYPLIAGRLWGHHKAHEISNQLEEYEKEKEREKLRNQRIRNEERLKKKSNKVNNSTNDDNDLLFTYSTGSRVVGKGIRFDHESVSAVSDIDKRCRLILTEIDRISTSKSKFTDSSVLHALKQRFPTDVLHYELEHELSNLLRSQIIERERMEDSILLPKADYIHQFSTLLPSYDEKKLEKDKTILALKRQRTKEKKKNYDYFSDEDENEEEDDVDDDMNDLDELNSLLEDIPLVASKKRGDRLLKRRALRKRQELREKEDETGLEIFLDDVENKKIRNKYEQLLTQNIEINIKKDNKKEKISTKPLKRQGSKAVSKLKSEIHEARKMILGKKLTNIEKEKHKEARLLLGIGGCLACMSRKCNWKPIIDEKEIKERLAEIHSEITRINQDRDNEIFTSNIPMSAQKGYKTKFSRSELLYELTWEEKQLNRHMHLNDVDKELHDALASRSEYIEVKSLHGYPTLLWIDNARNALSREHGHIVAEQVALEVVEGILDWMLEGWMFGEYKSGHRVAGYVPSLKKDGFINNSADQTKLKDAISLLLLERRQNKKSKNGLGGNDKDIKVLDINRRGSFKTKLKPIELSHMNDIGNEKAIKEGSDRDHLLNETEQTLKFGLLSLTLMYFRSLYLIRREQDSWSGKNAIIGGDSSEEAKKKDEEEKEKIKKLKILGLLKSDDDKLNMTENEWKALLRKERLQKYLKQAELGAKRRLLKEEEEKIEEVNRLGERKRRELYEKKAVITLQRIYRGYLGRKVATHWARKRAELEAIHSLMNTSALTIQRIWRGKVDRERAKRQRGAMARFINRIRLQDAKQDISEFWSSHSWGIGNNKLRKTALRAKKK